jgi:hypothetical protein
VTRQFAGCALHRAAGRVVAFTRVPYAKPPIARTRIMYETNSSAPLVSRAVVAIDVASRTFAYAAPAGTAEPATSAALAVPPSTATAAAPRMRTVHPSVDFFAQPGGVGLYGARRCEYYR